MTGWRAEMPQIYEVAVRNTSSGQRIDCAPVDIIIPADVEALVARANAEIEAMGNEIKRLRELVREMWEEESVWSGEESNTYSYTYRTELANKARELGVKL